MRLFALLALYAFLCATASAQTLKSLMYNTTNGQVAANTGTNTLMFTNGLKVGEDITLQTYGFTGYNAEIDFEEKDLVAGGGNNWKLGGSGFDNAGIIEFSNTTNAATTRTNLGLPLPALTNTSNVTAMRALSGSTNTAHPYSGTFEVVGPIGNYFLVFSNGILQDLQ